MKLLVGSLALLCFATIDAAVFSSDLRIQRAPRAKHAISAGTRRLHRADRLKSGSQPITDFLLNDDVLLTEVSLGTPAQKFTYLITTGYFSNELTALSTNCKEPYGLCSNPYGTSYTRALFNPSASTSYKSLKAYDDSVISGTSGVMSTDVLQIGGFSVSLTFALAQSTDSTFDYSPIDGVLPLGLDRTENGGTKVIDALKSQLDAPLYTIWLDKQLATNGTKAKDGAITFGALDTVNCGSSWTYTDTIVKDDWTVGASGIEVGRYQIQRSIQLAIDTSYSTLAGPPSEVQAIANALGASLDDTSAHYMVDCNGQLPDIVFAVAGITVRIPPSDYLTTYRKKDMFGNELCAVAIDEAPDGGWGFGPDWIAGTPFMRAACVAYDFDKERVGFAQSKPSSK